MKIKTFGTVEDFTVDWESTVKSPRVHTILHQLSEADGAEQLRFLSPHPSPAAPRAARDIPKSA